MDLTPTHPAGNQTLRERTAHGHNSIKAAERDSLHALVEPVFQSAATESVHGGDRRNSEASRDVPMQHVGAVSVRVDDRGAISAAHLADTRALAQIGARWNRKTNHLDTGVLQGTQVGLTSV